MGMLMYKDPDTGEWTPAGVGGGGTEIPIQDTAPESGDWWLDTSEDSPSVSSGVTMELLWENESPATQMGAFTVTFEDGEFDAFLVQFNHAASCTILAGALFIEVGKDGTFACVGGYSGTNATGFTGAICIKGRGVSTTATSIAFSTGYISVSGGTFSANTNESVPVRIYGIKGVS